jgi:hypothetical protein
VSLPIKILNRLRLGRCVAAEVSCEIVDMRAWVVVIPQAPSPHARPEVWFPYTPEDMQRSHGEYRLVNTQFITGFEIRYVRHKEEFTNEVWGWDYDLVLDDITTRVRRVFVDRESEIESALATWLADMNALGHPHDFDSSLIDSPIEGYLDRPWEREHLWEE